MDVKLASQTKMFDYFPLPKPDIGKTTSESVNCCAPVIIPEIKTMYTDT